MASLLIICFLLFNFSCNTDDVLIPDDTKESGIIVEKVIASGTEGNYSFAVTIRSPDTGCDQYADWWEVITDNEELVYRRILAHSHVDEQPFTRSGAGVAISETDIVIIRGHMNNTGYSEATVRGSVKEGFEPFEIAREFADSLEQVEPLPKDCLF